MCDELENIARDEDVKCPNVDCDTYGKFSQCFNKSYILCSIYDEWWNGLSNEQVFIIHKNYYQID